MGGLPSHEKRTVNIRLYALFNEAQKKETVVISTVYTGILLSFFKLIPQPCRTRFVKKINQ
jgi:hypothetical protein